MARNRKSKTEDDVSWIPERQKAAPVPKSVPTEESAKTIAAAVVETVRQQPVESVPLPGPSHTQDKATVRADLDSLRNIANSAARSAIAQYTTKSTREKLFFRLLLLTLSVSLAAVLLTLSIFGGGNFMSMGWCALVASGAFGADILLRAKSMRSKRSRPVAPAKRPSENNPVESDKSPR